MNVVPGEPSCIRNTLFQIIAGFQQSIDVIVIAECTPDSDSVYKRQLQLLQRRGYYVVVNKSLA